MSMAWRFTGCGRDLTNRMEQVIGIRVDANGTVAMGHIMRCITIAKQMKYLRQKTIFFYSGQLCPRFAGSGGDGICLPEHCLEPDGG